MKVLTKKISCVIVALMVVSTILSGCRDIDDMGMSKADENLQEIEFRDIALPEGKQYKNGKLNICLITKVYGNSYWDTLIQAAIDAAEDKDVNLFIAGVAKESSTDKLAELMEKALLMEPDAIIVSPADTAPIIDVVNKIKEKGIPLIFVDTILNGQQFDVCLMTDNMQAGRMVAVDMLKKLKKLGYKESEALSVGIDIGSKQSQTIIERLAGFNEYWSNNAPEKWKVIDTIKCNDGSADVAYQQCLEFIDKNSNLAGLIGLNNGSTVGLCKGITERERKDIALVGFDYSDEIASLIEGGEYTVSTMVQLQYSMGYGSVEEAINVCEGVAVKYKYIDTGISMVDHSNYDNPYIISDVLRR